MAKDVKEPEDFFQVGEKEGRLPIYLRYQLFRALDEYAVREKHREQVGLLVGRLGVRPDGKRYLLVEDAIESPVGDDQRGRFDEALWKRARRIAAARHPNRQIVGWFHSRPEGGLEVSEEEQSVHKRFFPEDAQVLYLLDPRGEDRNFYLRDGASLTPVKGFGIYGKPSSIDAKVAEAPPVSGAQPAVNSVAPPVEQQSRVVERSLEKILRRLQKPPLFPKDLAIIVLLVMNALLIWFRPHPPVAVDTASLERGQAELSDKVGAVQQKVERLEKHLAGMQLLDEQLRLVAGLEEIDPALDDEEAEQQEDSDPQTEETVNPGTAGLAERSERLKDGAGRVELYRVEAGDTLSGLASRFYPEATQDLTGALGRYNRLPAPDYAIFPGDVLKVPPVESLL